MAMACCSESPELQIPLALSHWAGSGAKFASGLRKSSLGHSRVGTGQIQHAPSFF